MKLCNSLALMSMSKTFLIIAEIVNVFSQKNLLFQNLKHLTNNSIIKIKSDFYNESFDST